MVFKIWKQVEEVRRFLFDFSIDWISERETTFLTEPEFTNKLDNILGHIEGSQPDVYQAVSEFEELAISVRLNEIIKQATSLRERLEDLQKKGQPFQTLLVKEVEESIQRIKSQQEQRKLGSVTTSGSETLSTVYREFRQNEERRDLGPTEVAKLVTEINATRTHGFSLHVPPLVFERGKITVCIGLNASGKSTFLQLLAGDMRGIKMSGTIRYPSIDHLARKTKAIGTWPMYRQKILIVTDYRPLHRRVFANEVAIRFARNGLTEEQAKGVTKALIGRFGLFHAHRQSWGQLSSGQRAKLNLIMAIASAPELLLLDEPLANLDFVSLPEVISDLFAVRDGVFWKPPAIVITSHRIDDLERFADRVLLFEHGQVKEWSAQSHEDRVIELEFSSVENAQKVIEALQLSKVRAWRRTTTVFIRTPLNRDLGSIIAQLNVEPRLVANIDDTYRGHYYRAKI